MPVYEYFCSACARRFEALRPMSQANDAIACPICGAADTRKALSVFAAISKDAGGSRMVASSTASGCTGCSGGHCATCGH